VKRNLHYFSKKILPAPPSPFRSIQVNHSDESKHEPRIKRIITVERGETISILAQRYYGISNHTVMDHILTVNREITNPHQIREHQTIMLPEITEDSLIIQARDGKYGIWLETFPNAAEAESLSKELSLIDEKIEVLPRPVSPNETWYRATTGFFETREACVMAIQRMRMKGILSALKES
jgi:phage tail protein X